MNKKEEDHYINKLYLYNVSSFFVVVNLWQIFAHMSRTYYAHFKCNLTLRIYFDGS